MKSFISVLLVFSLFLSSALGQNPVKIVNGNNDEVILGAGGKSYNSGLIVATTASTSVTATATKVQVIHCTNSTSGVVTLTIENTAGDDYFTTVSLAANSVMVVQYGSVGLTYAGVKLSASANSSISCQFEGVQ